MPMTHVTTPVTQVPMTHVPMLVTHVPTPVTHVHLPSASPAISTRPRILTVAAAQLGPVQKDHTRAQVVARMIALMCDAHKHGVELVVYPELALTTFFPRWFVDDITKADHW